MRVSGQVTGAVMISDGVSVVGFALGKAEELLEQRDLASALAWFDVAEGLGEDRDRCAGGRWAAYMLSGEFENAWRESDAIRARGKLDPHRFWNGEDVRGKRVVLRSLHGFGDAVQMMRYAPALRELCDELIIEVPPALRGLAPCFAGVEHVITWGDDAPAKSPEWDVQMEVMELPYFFRTQIRDLPIAAGYLAVSSESRASVQRIMRGGDRPRVGIVWAAGEWDRSRGAPFELVERLVQNTGCEFWNLQGGPEQSAWISLSYIPGLRDAAECGEGILTLAAVIQELDLVITVDTLAAHLAGALGTPAWVLLQHAADWRWMVNRNDSPWYPSLRLYRQPDPGNWDAVLTLIEENLELWLYQQNRASLRA